MGYQRPFVSERVREIRTADFPIEKIVKERRSATRYSIFALFCFEVMVYALYRVYYNVHEHNYLWALVPGLAALVMGFFAWDSVLQTRAEFLSAYRKFYLRRYVSAIDTFRAEGYDINRIADKNALQYWQFYWAKNLKVFEEALFDYLRSFRRAEDLLRRQTKWAAANAKLTTQLEVLLQEFNVIDDDREEVVEDFSSIQNPNRRKEFLVAYRSRMAHERWLGFNHLLRTTGAVQFDPALVVNEEDFALKCLEKEASRVTSDSARSYYLQGLNADSKRGKKRFFNRALIEDVRLEEVRSQAEAAIAARARVKSESVTPVREVRYLSLQDFARERLFGLSEIAPDDLWHMCREIILALARPGQSGGRFGEHYFAEDTVKRMVRRQCNLYSEVSFEPKVFDLAVRWLLESRALLSKPKTDERTLSLSTNVKRATPQGAEIISMILRLKREMSGLPS